MLALFLCLSCQHSDNAPVTLPTGDQVPLTTQTATGLNNNNSHMWGYWRVSINPDTLEAEPVPLRGVEFSANVNTFLEPNHHPAGNLAIGIDAGASDLPNNLLAVDVTLKHPLPYDMYSGFDVRGIFIHNGSVAAKSDPGIIFGVEGNDEDAVLTNADGWTRWWNPNEFTTPGVLGYTQGALASFNSVPSATLNGYKVFMDDLGADQDFREFITEETNYIMRSWFGAGSINTRRYMLQFPVGQPLEYDYCVYASWVETDPENAGNPNQYEPDDFPPDANCPEAFLMTCTSTDSTAYYNAPGDYGGSIILDFEVFDWQGFVSKDAVDGINSEISEIRIESFGTIIDEPDNTYVITHPELTMVSDKGSDISSVYEIEIINIVPTQAGTEDLLISVLNTDPADYDSGFGSEFPTGAPLAAYYFTTVSITGGSPCPTPVVDSIDPNQSLPNIVIDDALIEGSDFVFGTAFQVRMVSDTFEIIGTGIDNTSSTSFTADFDLAGGPAEVYDLVITNDCGTEGTGEDLFTVSSCVIPTVTDIDPDCIHSDSYILNVEVSGSDFVEGSGTGLVVMLIDGATELEAEDVTWINGGLLECDFDLSGLPAGDYDVEVTQGCNPLFSDTLPDAFTIHNDSSGTGVFVEAGYDSDYDIRDHTGAIEVILTDDDETDFIEFFDFDYYGVTYSWFSIKSNGGVELDIDGTDTPGYLSYTAVDECGEASPIILPFGEDLDPDSGAGGTILYEVQGTTPDRTLTVMFDDVDSYYYSTGNPGKHTFSVTFFETSNLMRFQYEDPNLLNMGSDLGDPAIAYCTFEEQGYYPEEDFLFCAFADWPTTCIDFKAYEADLPDAMMIPPPACDYDTDYINYGYNSDYECSGSATTLDLGDDVSSTEVPIGFTFNYAGTDYTTVRLNSNGVLFFGSYDSDPISLDCEDNYTLTDCVTANSDDLDPRDFGEIKYETRTVGSDQVFIAEWEGVPSYYETGSSNTFQIILFDTTDTDCDDIRIQWAEIYEAIDTLIQYNAGNWDVEVCIYDDGGQPVPGSIMVVPD